jgi:hypothetical protein
MPTPKSHRRTQPRWSICFRLLALGVLIVLFLWLVLGHLLPPPADLRFTFARTPQIRGKSQNQRLAIVLPFIGSGTHNIPAYLDLFCLGAAGSQDVADFIILHNGAMADYQGECPNNVVFVNLGSTLQMASYLVRVVSHKETLALSNLGILTQSLAYYLDKNPYALVEFKPAYGHIFADFLQGYSHWGYSDLDVLFGDTSRWITEDEWNEYDVVTYSFGDQSRLYARGQFTFHRNTDKISTIWRSCSYLADLDERFAKVMISKDQMHFESAEGCYSDAILSQNDISVKYAPKAWTDVQTSDTVHTHGLYLTRDIKTQRHVIYKAPRTQNGKMLFNMSNTPPYWFESVDTLYKDRSKPLHEIVGALEPLTLPNDPKANCMYWARQSHQAKLCLDEKLVTADHNIVWKDGELYKQLVNKVALASEAITAPFYHFQEWKRSFRYSQLAPMHLSSRAASFILSASGVIPLYHRGLLPLTNPIPSPLGLNMRQWKAERSQLPGQYYCLVTTVKTHPDRTVCLEAVSWRDSQTVEILSSAPGWSTVDVEGDMTLTLTLEISHDQAQLKSVLTLAVDRLIDNMQRWHGVPCIMVIYVAHNNADALAYIRQRIASLGSLDNVLAALITPHNDTFEFVSRRALLNMVIDAVPTRWFISGLELERGLTISTETVFFAHLAARMYRNKRGTVMWLPQFALASGSLDVPLPELVSLHQQGMVKMPELYKEACDEPEGEHLNMTDAIWWNYTSELLGPADRPMDSDVVARQAKALVDLDEWITRIMVDDTDNLESIYYLDESPILLTDNLGPIEGSYTHRLVREVEELAGRRCYNGMRAGQLAGFGYHYDVVPGAFAVSTAESSYDLLRNIVSVNKTDTPSRCRGCYIYRGHYLLADEIADADVMRSVRSAITWNEGIDGKIHWPHEE